MLNYLETFQSLVNTQHCQSSRHRNLVLFLTLGFCPSGQTEEFPSNLSSPVLDTPLDSPLSCADLTLDSTGEITVEDVRDFLT